MSTFFLCPFPSNFILISYIINVINYGSYSYSSLLSCCATSVVIEDLAADCHNFLKNIIYWYTIYLYVCHQIMSDSILHCSEHINNIVVEQHYQYYYVP